MKFGIRGNIYNKELPGVALDLVKKLISKKVDFLLDRNLAKLIHTTYNYDNSKIQQGDNKKLLAESDIIISIGGDGTFLTTAKLVGDRDIPIIGVNIGKLGFLAETSVKQIAKFISDILENKYKIEERTVLQAACIGIKQKPIYGLNEIVVHQSNAVRTIEIQAYYNDQLVISNLADGLIISTPTGSTGYSMSAGGPVVNPLSDVIILAPMCPHTLTARPMILPDNGIINIKVESRVPIGVTADGNSKFLLKSPAVVEIKKAHYKIKLAKRLNSNYFEVLNKKLLWGEDVRKNKKLI
ncbi:MAG: NAD(+)/NADH kinase [Ignavibacteria bacterium]|jgi:NAD+ kinase